MVAKTSLYEQHVALGARMVDFHGWLMPLHYGSQLQEHLAVRESAGLFDVSHMTILDILGAGGRQFLRKLLANDIDSLEHNGRALYTCMCNEHGGIIDDLLVYQRASDNYRLILNSATRARDLAWIQKKSEGFSIGLQERKELSMLAVQGPAAMDCLMSIMSPAQKDAISTLTPFECVDVADWFFARTGYTGEDGLEIILPSKDLPSLWGALLNTGVVPCGLGARDTLRLESGFLLYGQDMNETTSPLESGLAWTVKFEPSDRHFIGMGALLIQKQQGVMRQLVGLMLEEKNIMRTGQRVITPLGDGLITSGTYSPTLKKSIALARVPMGSFKKVQVEIRQTHCSAQVGPARFLKCGKPVWGV